jgi:hypothetical protein
MDAEGHWLCLTGQIGNPQRAFHSLSDFEFRNLPAGLYEITGVVVDARGGRSTVSRLAKVEPGLGRDIQETGVVRPVIVV